MFAEEVHQVEGSSVITVTETELSFIIPSRGIQVTTGCSVKKTTILGKDKSINVQVFSTLKKEQFGVRRIVLKEIHNFIQQGYLFSKKDYLLQINTVLNVLFIKYFCKKCITVSTNKKGDIHVFNTDDNIKCSFSTKSIYYDDFLRIM